MTFTFHNLPLHIQHGFSARSNQICWTFHVFLATQGIKDYKRNAQSKEMSKFYLIFQVPVIMVLGTELAMLHQLFMADTVTDWVCWIHHISILVWKKYTKIISHECLIMAQNESSTTQQIVTFFVRRFHFYSFFLTFNLNSDWDFSLFHFHDRLQQSGSTSFIGC